MPTVLSVTLALGAYQLAKHGAIVARMSAVEEMAGAFAFQPVQCVAEPHGEPQPTTLALAKELSACEEKTVRNLVSTESRLASPVGMDVGVCRRSSSLQGAMSVLGCRLCTWHKYERYRLKPAATCPY